MRIKFSYSKLKGYSNLRFGSSLNKKKFLETGRSKRSFVKRYWAKGKTRNPYGFREY
jgi:hypothetical protein